MGFALHRVFGAAGSGRRNPIRAPLPYAHDAAGKCRSKAKLEDLKGTWRKCMQPAVFKDSLGEAHRAFDYRTHSEARTRRSAGDLARMLGWVSLGLGIAGLMMPRRLARSAGIVQGERWLQAIGTRELISGAGILMRPHKPGWLWSRVAGDAMDLVLIALAARRHATHTRMQSRESDASRRLGMLSAALAGISVLDLLVAWDHTARLRRVPTVPGKTHTGVLHVKKSLDVNCSPEKCYRFWRDVENFPRFMPHVERVESIDATHSKWQVRGPLRQTFQWDAALTSDVPGQQLGWETTSGSAVTHTGVVRFSPAPGNRGTRVEVAFTFHPPLGKAGLMLARLTDEEPSQQLSEDLRRFKQLIETGEISTTIGQPAGQRSAIGRMVHKGLPG